MNATQRHIAYEQAVATESTIAGLTTLIETLESVDPDSLPPEQALQALLGVARGLLQGAELWHRLMAEMAIPAPPLPGLPSTGGELN